MTGTCGDGACDAASGEDCVSCTADCGACAMAGACGNGLCMANESCVSCPDDCGSCPGCGDGLCSPSLGESCANCVLDCGMCDACNNDGTCDAVVGGSGVPNENCLNCADCGACGTCGDGFCSGTEDCAACAADCCP
jgi:hypothetical protein